MSDYQTELENVKRVVRRWARSFSNLDPDQVMAVWDSTYSKAMHQAEEFPDPIWGIEGIRNYNEVMLKKLVLNPRDQSLIEMEADVLGDVAWCYMRGTITFDVPDAPGLVTGQTRQTFILRKINGEWKLIHYHESRETPGFRRYFYDAHPKGEELRKLDQQGGNERG